MGTERGTDQASAGSLLNGVPTLVGAAANELQAPLVLLRQLSLALADDTLTAKERQRLTQQMTLTTERALRLTGQLGMGNDAPRLITLEPINAVSLCQEVVHELSPLFTAHGRSITVQPRSKIPLLVADRTLLRRILIGFGDNAVHYGSDDKPVRLTIAVNGDRVRMGVRDYGPAVSSDVWQRLEDRVSRQSPAPLARRPQASSVGLLAARQIAMMMGGSIGVTRHRDGATFYVDMHASTQTSLL